MKKYLLLALLFINLPVSPVVSAAVYTHTATLSNGVLLDFNNNYTLVSGTIKSYGFGGFTNAPYIGANDPFYNLQVFEDGLLTISEHTVTGFMTYDWNSIIINNDINYELSFRDIVSELINSSISFVFFTYIGGSPFPEDVFFTSIEPIDFIGNSEPISEPISLLLLGVGLVSFSFNRRKQIQK